MEAIILGKNCIPYLGKTVSRRALKNELSVDQFVDELNLLFQEIVGVLEKGVARNWI